MASDPSPRLEIDERGRVTLHADGSTRSLGHVEDAGDYDAPESCWGEWQRLRDEWRSDVQSSRLERAERSATYRSQQGF